MSSADTTPNLTSTLDLDLDLVIVMGVVEDMRIDKDKNMEGQTIIDSHIS